uniref:Receptor expression-enhancing protein n=1 Tax=Nothobranchius furzeri TaxID=105023 RepID=A0A8C6P809_NOTFU
MLVWVILFSLVFGTLYPAYSSYKAVKTKDVKEYVKWMMYWIIFALFTTVEVFTDMFVCWLPFYYELKIAFVVWLLSPYTKGSSVLYRKFVHPTLSSKEKDIDEYICQAKDKSYDTLVHFGRKGLNVAATAAVMAATKGQGVLSDRLRSFSMQDLSSFQSDPVNTGPGTDQPAAAQHRSRPIIRSKSESYKVQYSPRNWKVAGSSPAQSVAVVVSLGKTLNPPCLLVVVGGTSGASARQPRLCQCALGQLWLHRSSSPPECE